MKNVVYLTDPATIKKEAAHWIARLDGDDPLSPKDREALRDWIQRSPAHREALYDAAALWDSLNILTELAPEAIEIAGGEPAATQTTHQRAGVFFSRGRVFASIAAAATILIVGLFFFQFARDPLGDTNGYYATAIGAQQSIQLADGSEVKLNTDTRINVNFANDIRDITLLQGEAHFAVAENKNAPFRVNAGAGQVLALGTAFSVYLKEASVDVTVTEGRVSVSALSPIADGSPVQGAAAEEKERIELVAGQLAVIRTGVPEHAGRERIIERHNLSDQELAHRMLWRDGILAFSRAPLRDVVAEISRYTTMDFEYSSNDVAEMPVIARFPVGDTELMLNIFENNFGLEVTHTGPDRVLLSAKEEVETE